MYVMSDQPLYNLYDFSQYSNVSDSATGIVEIMIAMNFICGLTNQ